jgi:hypothetical protein
LSALVQQAQINDLGNSGLPIPFENLRRSLRAIGVQTRMPGREAYSRLRPLAEPVVRWTLQHIAHVTREHAAVPVFVALDVVADVPAVKMPALEDADAAGFVVLNLLDVWRNQEKSAVRIADWDEHPNAKGNAVIADRFVAMMYEHRSELGLDVRISDLRAQARPTP